MVHTCAASMFRTAVLIVKPSLRTSPLWSKLHVSPSLYGRMFTHICVFTCGCTTGCLHTSVCVHICLHLFVCTPSCLHQYLHRNVYTFVVYTFVYSCLFIFVCLHPNVYIFLFTNIQLFTSVVFTSWSKHAPPINSGAHGSRISCVLICFLISRSFTQRQFTDSILKIIILFVFRLRLRLIPDLRT